MLPRGLGVGPAPAILMADSLGRARVAETGEERWVRSAALQPFNSNL